MKNKIFKICNLISVFALAVLLCLLGVYGAVSSTAVYAATSEEVLQDLRKDKDFNENDYPYVADDYSLQVIQIAESANNELFVYAYQPCHDTYDLIGTKISISYGYSVDGSGLTPKPYNLKLVSTSGTLDKYHVEGFTVPNDGDRYYNIVEIFRMVNTDIDGEQDPSFPTTDKAYAVGQQWYACDLNGSKHYEMNTFKTLPVETVFNSDIVVKDGFTLGSLLGFSGMCNVWFYCFNVDDYVIKHIFDADLNYSIRDVRWLDTAYGNEIYSNERENQVITLTDTDIMTVEGVGLGAKTHKWNKILSSKKFIEIVEEEGLSFVDNDKEKIKSSQWVFTFLATERVEKSASAVAPPYEIDYSDVYDVGLLRLHFQDVSGNYYDLGVVNDLTNPDNISSGEINDLGEKFKEFWEMFVKVILLIIGVILLVLLLNFVTPIMGILKFVFKGVVWLIGLPFRLLKSIFKRRD